MRTLEGHFGSPSLSVFRKDVHLEARPLLLSNRTQEQLPLIGRMLVGPGCEVVWAHCPGPGTLQRQCALVRWAFQ